jgi:hypothetical protein
MVIDTHAPRSRRALLAGALGGVAAAVATALGRPAHANAAAGSTMIIGSETNDAGSANTQLLTNSSVVAFKLLQNGPGTALMGYATPATGATRGVYGRSDSPNGFGVQARNQGAAGTGAAVQAIGGSNVGLDATSNVTAVRAISSTGYAVHAESGAGHAVYGFASNASNGYDGGHFITWANAGYGVFGRSNGDGTTRGVYGDTASATGIGVDGFNPQNIGVRGYGATGVYGTSPSAQFGTGVSGVGGGTSGHGVVGSITSDSGTASGVYGASAGSNSYAGYFEGHVGVTGTLSKGGGSFRIDHPLDPANRILQHSFVESPDMLNIYNGIVTADAGGEATVELPAWFMALNRDFRYGLTPIGEFAPLYVKSTVDKGRFTIAGAKPGQDISWQLTGIRKDAWAEANRIEVELDKAKDQRGRYLHPIENGRPASSGVDYPMQQRLAAARELAGEGRPRT